MAKLTAEAKAAIARRARAGESRQSLAAEFGVSAGRVGELARAEPGYEQRSAGDTGDRDGVVMNRAEAAARGYKPVWWHQPDGDADEPSGWRAGWLEAELPGARGRIRLPTADGRRRLVVAPLSDLRPCRSIP